MDCKSGSILKIDLRSSSCLTETAVPLLKEFFGGMGINWWLLYKNVNPSVAPLDPDNVLLFGTGLLAGTLAPCACRYNISAKNPITEGVASSSSGGHFASELRFAGYDNIMILGKAERPVYLWIDNDKIEVRNASHLWGCTVWETNDRIKEEVRDNDIQIAAIGPAGENLVKYACVIANRTRAAGKCGMGAVMGSKNLKAIAVRGTGSVEVAFPERFMEVVEKVWSKIKGSETYANLTSRGTLGCFSSESAEKLNAPIYSVVRNSQDEYVSLQELRKISCEVYSSRYVKRSMACFACPFHCSHFVKIDDGPYAGLACEKLELSSIVDFGFNLGVDYAPAIIKAHALANTFGLDMDSTSCAIAWAFECYQRGIITKADTDGLELKWGDHETIMKLVQKIAYRDGFGDVLAEGVKRASRIIGKSSDRYAMEIKGMGNIEHMRNAKAWSLGVAVALRGGGHATASPLIERYSNVSPELCRRIYGVPKSRATDRLSYRDKAKLVVHTERMHAVLDSLGVCIFAGTWFGADLLGPDELAELLSAATGWRIGGKDIMASGERILSVGKAFNTLHAGFDRKNDLPPARAMNEPISGPFRGERLEADKFNGMLDEYYRLHGWNIRTGRQTGKALTKLCLSDIAVDLEKAGLLTET